MLDRLYMPFIGLLAIAAIALAMVWPQGLGDRSWGPFGHTPLQQTPAMRAAMKREQAAADAQVDRARASVRALQQETLAPGQ